MIRLDVTVEDIVQVLAAGYTLIRVYTDTEEGGAFSTLDGTEALVAGTTGYAYLDTDGTTSTWYKVAYYGAGPGESSKSDAQQGGTVDGYCSAFEVRRELAGGSGEVAIGEEHDAALWDIVVEVSRLIDEYKQVPEGAYLATASETRYLDGDGSRFLWLEWPAVSVSLVEVEETDGTWTEWGADDWWSWPYSGPGPIDRLDVSDRSSGSKSVWDEGRKRVRVTGVWGVSATVPALVARACKTQAARWWKRAMQGWSDDGGGVGFGTLEYEGVAGLDRDVRRVLAVVRPRQALM